MRLTIGEKIHNIYKVFIVALPNSDDEYIRVSWLPVLCIDGTFYYNDNTAETLDAYRTMMDALTPEWAEKHIGGYQKGMKLTPVYGFCDYYHKFDAEKANEKLRRKLSQMTRWEFYNKNW